MNAVLQQAPEFEQDEDAIAEELARKTDVLTKLGASLEADKDKAIAWRRPFEQRWLEDLRQKHGEQPTLGEVKGGAAVMAGRSRQSDDEFRRTVDNITKPACIQIAARLSDMLFPTNERNWDLKPSPLPELVDPDEVMIGPDGQPMTKPGPMGPEGEPGQPVPLTAADIAERVKKMATQKCERMVQQIDDALQEGKYAKHGRRAIDDAVDMGTGVIKSPVIRRDRQMAYTQFTMPDGSAVPSLKVKEKDRPTPEWRDLWNFFPQPCRDIKEAEHAYFLHLLTTKKLRELAKQPGFDKEQINELLKQEPDAGSLGDGGGLVERDRILSPSVETMQGRYTVWEYDGPIPREALEVMGFEFDEEDKLTTVNGEVWFSQGVVIKVNLNTDEYSDCLPYHLFCYEKDPTSCFGFGVPYNLRTDQYAVNQTWHAVMLNAFMSAGAQVGVVPGMMEPINGKVDLTCIKPKVWGMKDGVTKIGDVLSFWHMENFTGPLMQVYETARRNAADKTLLPAYQDGRAAEVTKTSSGLAMLMNSSNIVQREGAKSWDDDITIPVISSFNRWFLLNGDDEEAKGDFQVIPKGESYLLVKDVQAQHVQVLTQIAENPRYAPYFDTWELLQLNVKMLNLPVEGLLRDRQTVEDEMKQAQGQPDPETIKAQAAQAQAEAATQRAQAEAERAASAERMHMADLQDRREERIAKLTMMEAQLGIEGNKLLSNEATEMEKIAARERTEQHKNQLAEVRLGAETRLKAEQLASKERETQTEIAVEAPNIRLA